MGALMCVISIGFGFAFGVFAGFFFHEKHLEALRRKRSREVLGSTSFLEASSLSPEATGLSLWAIEKAVLLSFEETELSPLLMRVGSHGFSSCEELMQKAGLSQALTKKGFACSRIYFSFGGLLAGSLVGAVFSSLLAAIGGIAGFAWGWGLLPRAMKEEARCRAFSAEQQFSQMIEVLVLGLKSGMSFDRAISLYCDSFKGPLSSMMSSVQGQWSHSLIDRNEGLRQVARSYDSALFDRFAENVIRSIRFGTSMSDSLSLLAVEARAIRKAKLEERVAKAPVKMLLPVGTLILPAMLILVMGPIMLDLMKGF